MTPTQELMPRSPQPAIRACRLFECSDLDEARERISTVMQPHQLRPLGRSGAASYHMDYLPMGRVGLGTIQLGHAAVDVGTVDDYHLVLFCVSGHARLLLDCGEVVVGGPTGVCIAPGDAFRGEFSADCEQLVLRIDPRLVDDYAGRGRGRLASHCDLTRPALRPWIALVNSILAHRETIDLIRADRRVAADFEELCVSLLLAGQGLASAAPAVPCIAPGSVRRAETFIRKRFAEPLRLEDIAQAAGVPSRTLLQGFRQFRDTTPMRFLRKVRLDCVHEGIARSPDASVATLAMEAGFGHLGRFSREYAERFGELPSRTRLRMRAPSRQRS